MLNDLQIERTLNKNGSFPPYRLVISGDMRAWLSWTMSSRLRCVSRSLEGRDGCVPIHSCASFSKCFDRYRPIETDFRIRLLLFYGKAIGGMLSRSCTFCSRRLGA